MTARARLATVELPDFGMPEAGPEIPPSLYAARLDGFGPRFEEALLVGGSAYLPPLLLRPEHAMALR